MINDLISKKKMCSETICEDDDNCSTTQNNSFMGIYDLITLQEYFIIDIQDNAIGNSILCDMIFKEVSDNEQTNILYVIIGQEQTQYISNRIIELNMHQ